MSMILRLSYTDHTELEEITKRLQGLGFTIQRPPQKGQYKRAYFKEMPVTDNFNTLNKLPDIDEEFPISKT